MVSSRKLAWFTFTDPFGTGECRMYWRGTAGSWRLGTQSKVIGWAHPEV